MYEIPIQFYIDIRAYCVFVQCINNDTTIFNKKQTMFSNKTFIFDMNMKKMCFRRSAMFIEYTTYRKTFRTNKIQSVFVIIFKYEIIF